MESDISEHTPCRVLSQSRTVESFRRIVPSAWPHDRTIDTSDMDLETLQDMEATQARLEYAYLKQCAERQARSVSESERETALGRPAHAGDTRAHQQIRKVMEAAGPKFNWIPVETFVPGANGLVFCARVEGTDTTFVIKTVDEKMATPERTLRYLTKTLRHEAFLGLKVTNGLRRVVPHFAHIYAGFSAPPCARDDQEQVVSVMDDRTQPHPAQYVIYEHISGAETFTDHLASGTATLSDVLSCWTQVALALAFAGERADYSHNDCYTDNIMWRPVPGGGVQSIVYPFWSGQKVRVRVTHIAVLIDLASSTGLYTDPETGEKRRSVGTQLPAYLGVTAARSNRGYDVFSLVMSSLQVLNGHAAGKKVVKALLPFVSLFFAGPNPLDRARVFMSDEALSRGFSILPPEVDFNPLEWVEALHRHFCPAWIRIHDEMAPVGAGERTAPLWNNDGGSVSGETLEEVIRARGLRF